MYFTQNELKLALDPLYLDRGRHYYESGRVMSADVGHSGKMVSGIVKGSGRNVYKCIVQLDRNNAGRLGITGQCSCPVRYNCKHVAAVLLQVADSLKPEARTTGAGLPRELSIWFDRLQNIGNQKQADEVPDRLLYLLDMSSNVGGSFLQVSVVKTRPLQSGGYGKPKAFTTGSNSTARFVRPEDFIILRLLETGRNSLGGSYQIHGSLGSQVLDAMLDSGRCHWSSIDEPPLQRGDTVESKLIWELESDGSQSIKAQDAPGASLLLPLAPPWYLDLTDAVCGPVKTGLSDVLAETLAAAPPVPVEQADNLAKAMEESFPDEQLPAPKEPDVQERDDIAPVPCLRLQSKEFKSHYYGEAPYWEDFGKFWFDYGGIRVHPFDDEPQLVHQTNDGLELILRHAEDEIRYTEQLIGSGLEPDEYLTDDDGLALAHQDEDEGWFSFMLELLPQLKAQGWRIEIDPDFRQQMVEADEWYADLDETEGNDWFSLDLGVDVEGKRINLLPYLASYLRNLKNAADLDDLRELPETAPMLCRLDDGRILRLPMQRVLHLMDVLVELYDPDALSKDGKLTLSRYQSSQLDDLDAENAALSWQGGEELRKHGRRLRDFDGIQPVSPPKGLNAELRPYQQEGLNWLQFLREYDLSGILADDMGLGKTIQTLAHLLVEKESGRADRPSLVAAPTSLMFNWRREAERFAPELKVLTLQGKDRKNHFDSIPEHDLVLTTYPLLPRDADHLLANDFHLLVLDEAQHIKNPRAKAAQTARKLKARHRLCLTGTPLENHLGELWAQFHFLLPGMLGDEKRFRKLFRTPIEKHADDARRSRLSQRIAPFILRREKADVVSELPPKTEIVSEVELGGTQRDLYETIRIAMHDKVQKEIDKKGIARSQIVILDALLKLRQVCCDPRLLKLDAARKVKQSAKLEMLSEMLPEMVEEGRRVLLFSQFTSMLGLIEDKLKGDGIDYVKLTGQTRDRATPIDRFQNGEVPVFLISLKAGGSGLNLTAADTVIHYDPWWNPAVERQATDRAHRIGQDKNVFVYKLLTRGTVEEKIAAMQAKKQALADALFDGKNSGAGLNADDLQALFEPLG